MHRSKERGTPVSSVFVYFGGPSVRVLKRTDPILWMNTIARCVETDGWVETRLGDTGVRRRQGMPDMHHPGMPMPMMPEEACAVTTRLTRPTTGPTRLVGGRTMARTAKLKAL